MRVDAASKYVPFQPIDLPDRQWPSRVITKAPIWCSVDLRDGNQALIEPMGLERKKRFFEMLCNMGFKEIEIGFPSASQTDFDFCRWLIEEGMIPDGVIIQVLTQSREELITRTFEAIAGSKQAIVHLYNSTSTLQRRVVFGLDRAGITEIAVEGAKLIRRLTEEKAAGDTEVLWEYSPESFTGTELDYAKEICEAVMDVYQPTPDRKLILNLPATVEMATPNVYADQIEWFHRNIRDRDSIVLSVHPHNDRGTAVAATELAVMAGADRVEGTLFGNGERTGNVDIVTLALNLFTQGVDPELEIDDINELVRTTEYCNQLPVHPRHPYAGELVFTAFSGSHQDAINKGLKSLRQQNAPTWEVPYLPMDPADVGRSYEAVIRINSQSGKGGIAYVLETDYGVTVPRRQQIEFSKVIQEISDREGIELPSKRIWETFESEYLTTDKPFEFLSYRTFPDTEHAESRVMVSKMRKDGETVEIEGSGSGPIDGFVHALQSNFGVEIDVVDYREHAVGTGSGATAYAYVEIKTPKASSVFGVGRHKNIVEASLRAIVSAVNRAARDGVLD